MKIFSKRFAFLVMGIFLLASFTLFSKYVKNGGLKDADFDTTVKLQNKIPGSASGRIDELMDDGAILADPIVSSALVMILTGLAFLKVKGKKRVLVFAIPLAFFVLTVTEAYGKNFLPHPGPPFFMIKHPTTIFPKFHVIEPYSYPSGHAARITFLAVILFFLTIQQYNNLTILKKRLWILSILILYVVFVATSRIYLGHHWLSDILGGWLLGGAFAVASAGLLL